MLLYLSKDELNLLQSVLATYEFEFGYENSTYTTPAFYKLFDKINQEAVYYDTSTQKD